ncbi:MAG TPA: hypothetical protein VHT71_15935 [Methylomirabilota bacterium]|nr:hypothetical protein [Methylomirabilota bacterium]
MSGDDGVRVGGADGPYEAAIECELTAALERYLPQHAASLALKRRLAAQWPAPPVRPVRRAWWPRAPILAIAALGLLATLVVLFPRGAGPGSGGREALVAEAVNDHLRVLASARPLEIENAGLHQVKPWFEGRLDFAPVVAFEGDAEFELRGGAVGYFMDRKAAVLVYGYRLHLISLLVFRADGLRWPGGEATPVTAHERGFSVVMWRERGLGYALTSDVEAARIATLAARLRTGP